MMRTIVAGSIALVLVPVSAHAGAPAAPAPAPQQIVIDGQQPGRVFDGVGALSAGASSRLLIDYPEPQRSRILDYLFKPGYGAALQILRVEIGGDTNSTAGSEASHMRTRDDRGCDRGYEWWLMREAKKRNPDIKLAGLEWGAPGWFEGGFWSRDNIEYQIAWLDCARSQGLTIDYMGGWNESEDFDPAWFVEFKRALREQGYGNVKLVAADGWGPDLQARWKVADAMATNPEFGAAVDVAAVHYPCGGQYNGAPYDHCPSTQPAQDLGKPLWSGEQGSQRYDIGAGPLAKAINRSYIDGRMTATLNWSLVASFYGSIPYAGTGLMRAYEPWSGYFEASKSLWAVAHTAQFTKPGWRYIDSASGYLDGGGSFVTLRAPDLSQHTTVIETLDAHEPQAVRLSVGGGLSTKDLQVWRSAMNSDRQQDWFRHDGTLSAVDGGYTVILQPGQIYTLSTATGAGKGAAATPPTGQGMRLPYADRFDTTPVGRLPKLFSDFNGGFEIEPCRGGRHGTCLGQRVTIPPIEWRYVTPTPPLTVLGDPNWRGDYAVSVDAYLDEAPYVDLLGRVDGVQLGHGGQPGYRLRLAADGSWTLIEQDPSLRETTLAAGRIADARRWHRLGLRFTGPRIQASVDDRQVADVADERHNRGQVGLLVGDWKTAQFDNLSITPTGTGPVLLPQAEMRASASNANVGYEASTALDSSPSTMWHTSWSPPSQLPQSITLDLGRPCRPRALIYTPRSDGNPNANVTAYRLYVGTDGSTFRPVAEGTWPATAATKSVEIPVSAGPIRYLRLEVLAGNGYGGAAELNVALTPP